MTLLRILGVIHGIPYHHCQQLHFTVSCDPRCDHSERMTTYKFIQMKGISNVSTRSYVTLFTN